MYLTTSFVIFLFLLLFALAALCAAVAVFAGPVDLVQALWTDSPVGPLFVWHYFLRCFLNPPKRAFFFGCTRWIVRIANFANP